MTTNIWWIRRDLRLADNPALTAAFAHASQVIPVFILDPFFERSSYVGEKRRAFLWAGLRQLDANLRQRGSYLVVRRGEPLTELTKLTAETQATTLFAEADFSTYARRRDATIAQSLPLKLAHGLTLHPPTSLLKPTGEPYTVYTPFKNAWMKRPLPTHHDLLPSPKHLATPPNIPGKPLPDSASAPSFPPDEATARLEAFTHPTATPNVFAYADQRNQLDLDGTSKLSPYLRLGMISLRQAMVAALTAANEAQNAQDRQGAETWLNELIWREFYLSILYHFPQVLQRSFRPELQNIPWNNNQAEFRAWCEGKTGYPVVDAAMRQLLLTGWIPNRARMIVASFLIKDLLINWQWGERWFMQQLIDGDPAANNGGWQWTAGTGTDAAPYFRVFNPVLQSAKFDPSGSYIRRYLPELTNVPHRYIHAPWEMPPMVQQQVGCIMGRDYPYPMVDHHTMRDRTLEAYRKKVGSISEVEPI